MSDKKDTGMTGEKLTAAYLERHGYKILSRNYTVRGGEIDIIAEKDGIIAFTEVKTRSDNYLSSGASAVTAAKQKHIIKTSIIYMMRSGSECQPRYDVSEVIMKNGKPVRINYYENAFTADGFNSFI